MKEKKVDILQLESDVMHFLRSFFLKGNKKIINRKTNVRKPTVKEMRKHGKLIEKQRKRLGRV